MSHKHKNRREATNQSSDVVAPTESQIIEKSPTETRKTAVAKPAKEEGGFSWQLIFVLGAMALGFLVLVGKSIGLF